MALLLLVMFPLAASAQNDVNQGNVVRVGWFESIFNHKDADGRRSGYSYDYQLRVAANNGWNYDYVNGTYEELYQKLLDGRIDLLSRVTYSDRDKDKLLYSDLPMGLQNLYIITLATSSDIIVNEPKTLDGKRIGVLKESIQLEKLKEWASVNNVDIDIREYAYAESEFLDLLLQNEVDGVVAFPTFDPRANTTCIPVQHLGTINLYFAVAKNQPELKHQLDMAMSKISAHNVYYNNELHEKYLKSAAIFKFIPYVEADWIKQHGVIRIGYRDNYLPYSGTDPKTGKPIGLLQDFIEAVNESFHNLDLYLEAIPYPTINAAMEAVQKGEVDVAFPSGISNYDAEQSNILMLDNFVTSSEMAVIRKDEYFTSEGNVRVAINADNPNYLSLIHEHYPNWQLVHFPSTHACLEGVAKGEADLLLISNYRLGVLDEEINKLDLKTVATGAEINLTFTVDKRESLLFSIMNRFTKAYSQSQINASIAKYSETIRHMSFSDFLKEHLTATMLTMIAIIAIMLFLCYHIMRQHHKAEAANKAKTRFLFSMSHDIRTPMNAIMGYTELIKANIDDKAKVVTFMDKLMSAGKFLLDLINNVLELARIESGSIELREKPEEADKILMPLKDLYIELFDKKGIEFTSHSDTRTKVIYCDALKLSEIYLNILSNALKYTPKGGRVNIDVVETPGSKEGYIRLTATISDTGIGMSKEYLPHIFDDFSREQTFTDSKINGTGLGMAIVKKLITLMGGTISVESELGKGTTFTFSLEHKAGDESMLEQPETTAQKELQQFSLDGKRILLAEDNDLNAEIAEEILSSIGLKVEHAEDGLVCVSKIEEAPAGYFDLVLMDIQMPNMNGYEATRKIRIMADKAKAEIPVIAFTANAFDDDKKNALEAGMNGHLSKPIEVSKLIETLKLVLKTKKVEK